MDPNAATRASTNPGTTRMDPNAATRASTNPGRPDSPAASREPSAAARSAMIGAPAPRAPTPVRPAAPADIDAGWGDSDSTSPRVAGPRPEAPQAQPRPESPRPRVERKPRPAADAPRLTPPPGMTDADVNALFANYVKAKEMVGESAGPGSYGKLLKTINAQAPKIMQQYNAKGVDFSIVVKDNQVIIRAKPKT
jgi:hypothetical protein